MTFSFANAQINVAEGFESGALPTGWGSLGFSFNNSLFCNGTKSMTGPLYNANPSLTLTTSSYISDGNITKVSINYKRSVGTFTGNIKIFYEVNGNNTWNQIASATYFEANNCGNLEGIIALGVIPAGDSVRFRVQGSWVSGSTTLLIDDFSAIQSASFLNDFTTEYNFDNTRNNTLGTNPFTSANTSFVTDRNGNPNSAMQIMAGTAGSSATMNIGGGLIPTGSQVRTVSLWYKMSLINPLSYTGVFAYGVQSNNQMFGVYLSGMGNHYFQNHTGDYAFSGNTTYSDVWRHLVVTYDSNNVKMYIDGNLIQTRTYSLNTGNSDFFLANNSLTNTIIDDLKIYKFALTQQQVTNLYTNNMLTSENFHTNNLEVGLYPNPVNDLLNIDTKEEILSIEVYSLQGQKVLSSKQNRINVAELPAGIYLVRIEDINKNIATKKILKN